MKRLQLNIGQKFSKLTVLGWSDKEKCWECQCECGNITYARGSELNKGRHRSCGCINKERLDSRLPDNLAAKRKLFYTYKNSAKNRGHDFNMDENVFFEKIIQNCSYCGIEPLMQYKYLGYETDFKYNGIDRYDNNKGYTNENGVTCCANCNRAKSVLTFEEWKNWIERAYNFMFNAKSSS